ncbi:MAG: hypothetical protein KH040_00930 [Collinsella sp.]|nr:hypothetical protein [Collinsella sp.]
MEESATGSVYTYDPHRYLFDVRVPAVLSAIAMPVSILMLVANYLVPVAVIFLVVSIYTLFNTLVAKTYPQIVALDETELSLTSFGRTDTYRIDEIDRLQVRENGMTRNAYIRVNGGSLLRGRYFVGCGDMYDADGVKAEDLYRFFLETEARLDPDNLRVRARAAEARKASAPLDATHASVSRRHRRKRK